MPIPGRVATLSMPEFVPTRIGGCVLWLAADRSRITQTEVQTIVLTGSPTGGTCAVTLDGQTTGAIAFDAAASAVQTALRALSNVGSTGVDCTGGPLPGTTVTCTFAGPLAEVAVAQMTGDGSLLTGGIAPAVSIATTVSGYSSPVNADTAQKVYDLSGQNNHVSQATAANRPTWRTNVVNGHPVLRFVGTGPQYLTGGDIIEPATITIFTVSSATVVATTQCVISKGAAAGGQESYFAGYVASTFRSVIAKAGPVETNADSTTVLSNNTFAIHTHRYDLVNVESRTNGGGLTQTAETAAILYSTYNFTLGVLSVDLTSIPLTGDIAEAIIYNRALSNGEMGLVHRYLSRHYALALAT